MREVYGRRLKKASLGIGWKTVEDELVAHLASVGPVVDSQALKSHLEFLRSIRNEVEHPQERDDVDRAERAIQHSVEVISVLARIP